MDSEKNLSPELYTEVVVIGLLWTFSVSTLRERERERVLTFFQTHTMSDTPLLQSIFSWKSFDVYVFPPGLIKK